MNAALPIMVVGKLSFLTENAEAKATEDHREGLMRGGGIRCNLGGPPWLCFSVFSVRNLPFLPHTQPWLPNPSPRSTVPATEETAMARVGESKGEYRGGVYREDGALKSWLEKRPREAALEPELPIIDPHHHFWDTP